jgi:hypothetical protein
MMILKREAAQGERFYGSPSPLILLSATDKDFYHARAIFFKAEGHSLLSLARRTDAGG